MNKTEDEVRKYACDQLGLDKEYEDVKCGVGQITTFNQLDNNSFRGISDKPDGWYLPKNSNDVAVVVECKSSDKDLKNKDTIKELKKNIKI